jgi:hypothetical protein
MLSGKVFSKTITGTRFFCIFLVRKEYSHSPGVEIPRQIILALFIVFLFLVESSSMI